MPRRRDVVEPVNTVIQAVYPKSDWWLCAKLTRERGGYRRISEAPPNIISAIFIAPPMTALGFNAMPGVEFIHRVQPLAETA
jgi:hypothetical protein